MITGVTPEWHQQLSIKQVVFFVIVIVIVIVIVVCRLCGTEPPVGANEILDELNAGSGYVDVSRHAIGEC